MIEADFDRISDPWNRSPTRRSAPTRLFDSYVSGRTTKQRSERPWREAEGTATAGLRKRRNRPSSLVLRNVTRAAPHSSDRTLGQRRPLSLQRPVMQRR
jgi:hypothetical protein